MTTEVRFVREPEQAAWLDQLGVGFFFRPGEGEAAYYFTHADRARARGAFDGEAVVGTLRSFPTALTVPGPATVAASALTAVTVAPTHRRRGLLREMIVGDLRDSAARGEVVSVLLASEYPIYGRFGYGPATEHVQLEVSTTGLAFRRHPEGAVELVDLPTLRRLAPPIFERFRASQPGSIGRGENWWDRYTRQVEVPGAEPRKGFQAVYRSGTAEPQGYVQYEAKVDWEARPSKGTLTVEELVATTPAAYHALWSFCVGVDLTTTVLADKRAPDEVLPHLVDDARKVRRVAHRDFLWVRILDACAALAARRYGIEGRLVLEVRDDLDLAAGRVALESTPDGARCAPTDEAPSLTVGVGALGATYLGGVSWTRLADAGLVEEHVAGALACADRLFLTERAPWCTTNF